MSPSLPNLDEVALQPVVSCSQEITCILVSPCSARLVFRKCSNLYLFILNYPTLCFTLTTFTFWLVCIVCSNVQGTLNMEFYLHLYNRNITKKTPHIKVFFLN